MLISLEMIRTCHKMLLLMVEIEKLHSEYTWATTSHDM